VNPRRALLLASWIAATLAATLVAYLAVQAVAGQVVERHPEPLTAAGVRQELKSPPTPDVDLANNPLAAPPASASSNPANVPSPGLGSGAATASTGRTPSTGQTTTSNSRPATAPAATPTPQPPPAPTSSTRTFSLVGGSASVTCRGSQVSLDWATPNSGFWVETGTSDSGTKVEVRFRSDSHESRLEAWCSGGQVQGVTTEESS